MPGAGWGGAGGRGGLGAVGWSVAAAERSGKVSFEVKTAAEVGALRESGGRGGPRIRAGPLPSRGLRTWVSWGAIVQQRIPGAPALEGLPVPGSCPPRHSGAPQPDPAVSCSRDPHSATIVLSRCGRERPCPTAPSSPARLPRECDIPSPSPLWATAWAPPRSRRSSSTPAPHGLDSPNLEQALPLGPSPAFPNSWALAFKGSPSSDPDPLRPLFPEFRPLAASDTVGGGG